MFPLHLFMAPEAHLLLALSNISSFWTEHSLCIHSSTERHLGCLQVLAVVIEALKYLCAGVCVDVSFQLVWVNEIAGSHGKGVFSFVGNRQTPFQSGCAVPHSHQQGMTEWAQPNRTSQKVLEMLLHQDISALIIREGDINSLRKVWGWISGQYREN